ncbi:MAG: hypothetical protein ACYDBX_04160 [Patescibacteria group bacterium]
MTRKRVQSIFILLIGTVPFLFFFILNYAYNTSMFGGVEHCTFNNVVCPTVPTFPFGPYFGVGGIVAIIYPLFLFITGVVLFALIVVSEIRIVSYEWHREKIINIQKALLVITISGFIIIIFISVFLGSLGSFLFPTTYVARYVAN